MYTFCVLRVLVAGVCAWCGCFRRLPARKILVVVGSKFGCLVCMSILECFVGGVNDGEVGSNSVCRFGLCWVGGLGVVFVNLLTESLGLVSSHVWLIVMCLIGSIDAGDGCKFCIACLPPGHFWISALVCEVGSSCIVHSW
jgi:hypothetical protein